MNEQGNGVPIRKQVGTRVAGYVTAALGLVAGLAWNDAISSLIQILYPGEQGTIIAKFVYASVITAIVVIATVVIVKTTNK